MFYKKEKKETYNKENQEPVLRTSICTGEKTIGFRDIHTGKFTEIMLIRNNKDMDEFMEKYNISKEEIKKEW